MTLQPLHSLEDVAAALGETPYFVKEKCRRREWPHIRGARGKPSFTAEQYAQILDLIAEPVAAEPQPRIAFAPRSRRSA